MTNGTRRGEGSASRPGRFLTPEKTRYPVYRRLGGSQSLVGQVRKISPPPGFVPRTVQPVASHYTDWATLCKVVEISIFTSRRYQSSTDVQTMRVVSGEMQTEMTNFPNYSERSAKKKAFDHSIWYHTLFQHIETFSTMKMEARDTFETLLIYQNTWYDMIWYMI
jgi:hypothetical protein